MLHQTLISPFFSFHRPSSSSPPSPLPYFHSSSRVEKETSMDLEMICYGSQLQDEEPWTVEKGNHIFGEEFVDEFLDLGGLTETEMELDGEKKETEEEEEEEDNSVSSAVSFEPPPPVSELALPSHDVAELEWVSRLMDDSLSEFPPPCSSVAVAAPPAESKPAQEISSTAAVVKAKSKRSKRTRSPSGSWSNWGPADYSTTSSSTTATASDSNSSPSYTSSSPLIFFTPITGMSPAKKQKIPKKRGRKPKPRPPLVPSISSAAAEEVYYTHQHPNSGTSSERRCSHCGVNKTPQWRAGPMGAKTLCNACGVRFKSGRLLPEYRPACSPTFVSHVHSNSHRKVLEMRRKKEEPETEKDDYLVCSAPAVPSF